MGVNSHYLNNAATTWPKPKEVATAMATFLETGGANLARGSASQRDLGTLGMVTTCRMKIAELFGGPGADPRYVTFTGNVTQSVNVVLKGFLKPGMRAATSGMSLPLAAPPTFSTAPAVVRVNSSMFLRVPGPTLREDTVATISP